MGTDDHRGDARRQPMRAQAARSPAWAVLLASSLLACGGDGGEGAKTGESTPVMALAPTPREAGVAEPPSPAGDASASEQVGSRPLTNEPPPPGGSVPSESGGQSTPPLSEASSPAVETDAAMPVDRALVPRTLHLAGDSIVQSYPDTPRTDDQAGWGQMLGELFQTTLSVDNAAIGGRTARRFIDEGRLDELSSRLLPGDYLLIQFGTNDGNRTATYELGGQQIPYFLDPQTEFKEYLAQYLDVASARGAVPVFVTPTPRNSAYCTGGNGTGAHAQAMRELGAERAVLVVDLNARAVAHLRAVCPAPSPEDFFLLRPDGSVDGTHFQERGARALAGFVAEELVSVAPELAPYRQAPASPVGS